MQRFFDILFSILAIIALSPLIIPTMLILKLTGEGEIFFRQARVGKNKVSFGLLKFATMLKNSERLGAATVTVKDDFRVLPFGKFLRKTKLDELPQLLNIVMGHMSVIGPRPLQKKHFSFYCESDQKIISSVAPGLSGVGSIIFRDEEEILQNSSDLDTVYKEKIMPEKALLEKWYVENRSISLYFKLIFLTLISVAFSEIDVKKFLKELQ